MNTKIVSCLVVVCLVLSILSLVLVLSNRTAPIINNGSTLINGSDSATERADSFELYLKDATGLAIERLTNVSDWLDHYHNFQNYNITKTYNITYPDDSYYYVHGIETYNGTLLWRIVNETDVYLNEILNENEFVNLFIGKNNENNYINRLDNTFLTSTSHEQDYNVTTHSATVIVTNINYLYTP